MSNTYKDAPRYVRAARAVKEGRIDHEHISRSPRTYKLLDQKRSVAFKKKYAKEIHAYREYLRSLGDEFEFEEEEHDNISVYDMKTDTYSYTPKRIQFTVYKHVTRESTYECIDPETYNAKTRVNGSNKKRATCEPDVPYRLSCKCYCCSASNRTSKNVRRGTLKKMQKAYNSGATVEELDEVEESQFKDVEDYGAPLTWAALC